jgi:hypothetical protein
MILRVYAKKTKRITFSYGVISLGESAFIENQKQI